MVCILQSNAVFLSIPAFGVGEFPFDSTVVARSHVFSDLHQFLHLQRTVNLPMQKNVLAHVSSIRMKPCRNAIFSFASSSLNRFTSAII